METGICYVPVSIGELYDKFTILQIKSERIKDPFKLEMVNYDIILNIILEFNNYNIITNKNN